MDVGGEARKIAEAYDPPLLYRPNSTDELVLREVLGSNAYRREDKDWSFDPRGHTVLDLGGQIGTFAVWAMEGGAATVHSCEPEPESAALLRANTARYGEKVLIDERAVVGGATTGTEELVLGRADQSSGRANTWRHALARGVGSHYRESVVNASVVPNGSVGSVGSERSTGPAAGPGGGVLPPLERVSVRSVTIGELLEHTAPSYVKMDIEVSGCER